MQIISSRSRTRRPRSLGELAALLALALIALILFLEVQGVGAEDLKSDYLADLDRASEKLVELAEAIPAESYSWRPTPEVRTVSESLMHVAASHYYLISRLGVEAPDGVPSDLEAVTSKEEVLRRLEEAIAHARTVAASTADRADEDVELFGQPATARRVLFQLTGHLHEHLGQLIVYARSVGVVPPWSRPEGDREDMTRRAKGSFDVVLNPLAEEQDSFLGRMSIDKKFAGDLEATSRGQMMAVRTATAGSAGYVAMELVTGELGGRRGTFVLQHSSTMARGVPTQSVVVIPDSGTDELEGLTGEMTIEITDGNHLYEFVYSLPEQLD